MCCLSQLSVSDSAADESFYTDPGKSDITAAAAAAAVNRFNLQLFADSDKTEEPTPRRKEEARKKGQVVKSTELNSAFNLLALVILFYTSSTQTWDYCCRMLQRYLQMHDFSLVSGSVTDLMVMVISDFFFILAPLFLVVMVTAVGSNFLQVGFLSVPVTLQLSRLNPVSGLQRMFSKHALVELIKALIKVVLVGLAAWQFIRANLEKLFLVLYQDAPGMWETVRSLALGLALRIALTFLALALADYFYQRYEYNKSLRMSRQEIKEELKQLEGDPQLKARIRETQRKLALQKMLQDIPSAAVLITNPTRLAVALRYREGEDTAPVVVAKGAGYIAKRIRERAEEHGVPVIQNKEVARLLYEQVELGEIIPVELYQAVAEILALVYQARHGQL
ncbi:MAG: flagellar biosynthesis protein FlhB [Dethiobacteraceae bacterium]